MNKKKNQEQEQEQENQPNQVNKERLKALFKKGKIKVVDPGKEDPFKVSTGSLNFDMITGGGFGPGIIRFVGATEGGKEQPLDEPVLTENGFVELGKLKVGDKVFTYNGNLSEITGFYPQGKKMTYKVSFDDGTFSFCGKSHLWQVVPLEKGKLLDKRILPLEEIMANSQYDYYVPLCYPINFSHKDLPVTPRELGKLLSSKISLNGLITKRLIPEIYLKGSVTQRQDLLNGITDNKNYLQTNSNLLSRGVVELVKSLGGHILKESYTEDGNEISWTFEDHYKKIVSIEKNKLMDCACIKIADDKGLYITRDYTVTHNTSEALVVMDNFLDKFGENARAIYIKCELRLSNEMKSKCRHPFIVMTSENQDEVIEKWDHTNILVYPQNRYDEIAKFLEFIAEALDENIKLIFIFDSLDWAVSPGEVEAFLAHDPEKNKKVAGAQKYTKDLLKSLQPEWVKRNWMSIWLSQVSSNIKINQYEVQEQQNGEWSGGNAIKHAADWTIQFFPKLNSRLIKEENKAADIVTNPILGQWAKVGIIKSTNETTGYKIEYPIKTNNGVWKEMEISDYLEKHILVKNGAWYSFPEKTIKFAEKRGITLPDKINGSKKLLLFLEENKDVLQFFYDGFMKAISKDKIDINTFAEQFSEQDIEEINKSAKN